MKTYELKTQLEYKDMGDVIEVVYNDEVLSINKDKFKFLKATEYGVLRLPDGQPMNLVHLESDKLYIHERMEDVSMILQECFNHDPTKRKSSKFRNAVVELLDELREIDKNLRN